jgi:hypothetical protein
VDLQIWTSITKHVLETYGNAEFLWLFITKSIKWETGAETMRLGSFSGKILQGGFDGQRVFMHNDIQKTVSLTM